MEIGFSIAKWFRGLLLLTNPPFDSPNVYVKFRYFKTVPDVSIFKTTHCKINFLLGLLWLPIGYGTTIQKLDIDDVVMEAELVFEGEVLTHEVRVDSNSNLINTFVTF